MNRYTLSALALAAVIGVVLSTAVLADRAGPSGGMHGMNGMPGMGPMPMFDFAAIDVDGDGKVTEAELNAFRQARITAMDANSDSLLSPDELRAAHVARAETEAAELAARMIEARDSDGDGLLSVAEMAQPPMPGNLFARLDTDGDGAISASEAEAAQARMAGRRMQHGDMPGQD